MLSCTDNKFISAASHEANKSTVLMRHGAVAVANGKILGRGHNHYRTTSKDGFINNTCTCHAEVDVMRKLYHKSMTNVYGKHSNNIKVV